MQGGTCRCIIHKTLGGHELLDSVARTLKVEERREALCVGALYGDCCAPSMFRSEMEL